MNIKMIDADSRQSQPQQPPNYQYLKPLLSSIVNTRFREKSGTLVTSRSHRRIKLVKNAFPLYRPPGATVNPEKLKIDKENDIPNEPQEKHKPTIIK